MTRKLGQQSFEADAVALRSQLNLAHPFVRACGAHLALPGLRAFWPMSAIDYQRPECTDISGHGYDLQSANALGDVLFGYDTTQVLAPVGTFSGAANSYLTRADGGAGNWADILGTEAYIIAAQRGLALGGWFYWAALPGAVEGLLTKASGAAQSYNVIITAGNLARMSVWPGAIVIASASAVNVGWNHLVGLYDQANQDIHIVLNGVVSSNAGAAPAALTDSAQPFCIGADGAGANLFTGSASMCFLCASFISTTQVQALYNQTRELYGV